MANEGKVKGFKTPKRYARSADVEHFAGAACPHIGVLLILAGSHRQNYKTINNYQNDKKEEVHQS